MGIVINIWNQKGGVGKTTLALTLGAGLTQLGYSVTLVDTDPQGDISLGLPGLTDKRGKPRDGIFNLLTNDVPIEDVLLTVDAACCDFDFIHDHPRIGPPGELKVLPSYARTATTAVDLYIRGKYYNALAEALDPLHDSMDFIIIDTPPSASLLTPSVLHVSDHILIPTLLERWSLDGIGEVYQVMTDSASLHTAEVLGIIPMRTRLNTLEHKDRLDELKDVYDDLVWESVAIPESILWAEAADALKPIFKYRTGSPAALAAEAVLKKFSEEVLNRVQ